MLTLNAILLFYFKAQFMTIAWIGGMALGMFLLLEIILDWPQFALPLGLLTWAVIIFCFYQMVRRFIKLYKLLLAGEIEKGKWF